MGFEFFDFSNEHDGMEYRMGSLDDHANFVFGAGAANDVYKRGAVAIMVGRMPFTFTL